MTCPVNYIKSPQVLTLHVIYLINSSKLQTGKGQSNKFSKLAWLMSNQTKDIQGKKSKSSHMKAHLHFKANQQSLDFSSN